MLVTPSLPPARPCLWLPLSSLRSVACSFDDSPTNIPNTPASLSRCPCRCPLHPGRVGPLGVHVPPLLLDPAYRPLLLAPLLFCSALLCWPSPVLTPTPASRPELTQPHRSAGSHQGRAFSLSYWDPHKPVGSRPVLSFAVPREAASFLQCEVSPPLPWGSQPLCSLRNLLLIVITLLSSVSNCPFFTGSSASTLRCP